MTKIKTRKKAMTAKIINRRDFKKLIRIGYRTSATKSWFWLFKLLFITLLIGLAFWFGDFVGTESTKKEEAVVVSVSDGDTLKVQLANGSQENIRLLGVDTPETHHPNKPIQCFGTEAENFTRANLIEKTVALEYDVQRKDKYGRTLAYVYLGEIRFNDVLLEKGFARTLSIEPNVKYANKFSKLEVKARSLQVGLWGYCINDN